MENEKIKANEVLYIKLGKGGEFVQECLSNNILKLSYDEVDHVLCQNKEWDKIIENYTKNGLVDKRTSTNHTNQIRNFYEASEKVLWITFHFDKLYWCFSDPIITKLDDEKKTRPVIGSWSDKDLLGKVLSSRTLSGKLTQTHGYRGTICKIQETEYLVKKINGEQRREVVAVEESMADLKNKLSTLITCLHPKDFEILVDLIFRQAGWQRVSDLGKTIKTYDLELLAPVTGERAIVKIKSKSHTKEFKTFEQESIDFHERGYKRFFIVHTSNKDLDSLVNADSDVIVYFGDKLSEHIIQSGLVGWLIDKTL